MIKIIMLMLALILFSCDSLDPVVEGCTNQTACNYNSDATENNNSCIFGELFYNCDSECLLDDDNDGICNELEINGCTDSSACNFSIYATENDNSCTFAEEFYNCEGECLLDENSDGICNENVILGCMDQSSCNYNELANVNNECSFAEQYYTCDGGCLIDEDNDGICNELEVSGCLDLNADNHDPEATEDGNNCTYSIAFVLCEGNFQGNNASLHTLNDDAPSLETGDTGSSMAVYEDKVAVVNNGSSNIVIYTISQEGIIEYFASIDVSQALPIAFSIVSPWMPWMPFA